MAGEGIGFELIEGIGGSNWVAMAALHATSEREPENAWTHGLPRPHLPEEAGVWSVYGVAVQSRTEYKAVHEATHRQLVRDIFGNPFRPVTISSTVLTWHDATVVRLAQTAYEERHMPEGTLDNARLAVLADALEEAGCQDQDVLGHCRSGGEHVKGCWVVDLLLGKT
jgi:hypothetical protein